MTPESNGSSAAVNVEDLEKKFGEFVAVDRISFRVDRGEIFGFIGSNGAGKTTTIRMLCGVLPPTSGTAEVAGVNVIRRPEAVKSRIGYMSQAFSLYGDLTVAENIRFYSGIYRVPRRRRTARRDEVLEMARLEDRRDELAGSLPRGLKQRLALGCALLHEPQLLFLDEPTSGVDPRTRRSFWELLYRFADRGMTIFVTTHYMEEAEYADRIGLIHEGTLLADGTPRSLKDSATDLIVRQFRTTRPEETLSALAGMDGVQNARLTGSMVRVSHSSEAPVQNRIESTLDQIDDGWEDAGEAEPSLEDVFASRIRQWEDRADESP